MEHMIADWKLSIFNKKQQQRKKKRKINPIQLVDSDSERNKHLYFYSCFISINI